MRRELGFWETAALSLGVMAPTLAMSLTGVEAVKLIGRAAPLAFVFAAVGVGLVSYGFIRLASRVASAGSVYAFTGSVLGSRVGFCTGWALLGTYLVFPPVSIIGVALFGQQFLHGTGIADHAGWLPIALVAWALIWFLAARGIRPTTRSLLAFEGVSLLLILVLMAVILVKLGVGSAPGGRGFTADVFRLPEGVGLSTVALAATFGFLSFAGFESAGSLGEEARAPTRAIPRAIVISVVVGAVFYVACVITQSLGFGTDAEGVSAFAGATAPLGSLSEAYVGGPMARALELGAMASALAAGLGGVLVSSRMLFAFSRDGIGTRRLGRASPATGVPGPALAVSMTLTLIALLAMGLADVRAIDAFFYYATIGVLSLLVMYFVTNVAAARLLGVTERRRAEALVPLLGCAVAGYVLYRNLSPVPAWPFNLFPYVVAAWLALGVVISLLVPRLARQIVGRPALGTDPTSQ